MVQYSLQLPFQFNRFPPNHFNSIDYSSVFLYVTFPTSAVESLNARLVNMSFWSLLMWNSFQPFFFFVFWNTGNLEEIWDGCCIKCFSIWVSFFLVIIQFLDLQLEYCVNDSVSLCFLWSHMMTLPLIWEFESVDFDYKILVLSIFFL